MKPRRRNVCCEFMIALMTRSLPVSASEYTSPAPLVQVLSLPNLHHEVHYDSAGSFPGGGVHGGLTARVGCWSKEQLTKTKATGYHSFWHNEAPSRVTAILGTRRPFTCTCKAAPVTLCQ